METNQNPVQEQSVQYITPENTQAISAGVL